jgi:hypothetical protein
MRPLSAAQLLDAWEQGLSQPAYRRVVPLLAAASPDHSIDTIAMLTIGQRDRSLLTIREWTFGAQLAGLVNCSACDERLEWVVNAADLYVEQQFEGTAELSLEADGYCVNFRPPNISDLAAPAECADLETAHRALLERCVLRAWFNGQEIPAGDLSGEIVASIAKRMAEADPQADLKIDLQCLECNSNWQVIFDIESFFWSEINAWAQRILLEIHLLARAYGWCESDILNLTSARRQFYLGLVSG